MAGAGPGRVEVRSQASSLKPENSHIASLECTFKRDLSISGAALQDLPREEITEDSGRRALQQRAEVGNDGFVSIPQIHDHQDCLRALPGNGTAAKRERV